MTGAGTVRRHPRLTAHLALPDRGERLPDRPAGSWPPTAAVGVVAASDPLRPLVRGEHAAWLQPLSDSLLAEADPAGAAIDRSSLRLAFVAALQHLSARQRGALILRDVLTFSASETADIRGTSVVSVNSSLQRARARVKEVGVRQERVSEPSAADQRAWVERYMRHSSSPTSRASSGCSPRTWSWKCRRCSTGSPAAATTAYSSPRWHRPPVRSGWRSRCRCGRLHRGDRGIDAHDAAGGFDQRAAATCWMAGLIEDLLTSARRATPTCTKLDLDLRIVGAEATDRVAGQGPPHRTGRSRSCVRSSRPRAETRPCTPVPAPARDSSSGIPAPAPRGQRQPQPRPPQVNPVGGARHGLT
jgi:sigma-70-like protein